MARTLPAALVTATTAAQLTPFLAVELDFDSGAVRYWSGYGTLTISGQSYTGVGTLGSITPIEETEDLSARGLTIQLSGIPSALISLALAEDYQGRAATVRFGALDPDTGAVLEVVVMFAGRMDVMTITDDGQSATISFAVENRLIDFQRTRESRYTHEEQQRRYPTDTGLEYVAGLQNKVLYWGNANPTSFAGNGAGPVDNTLTEEQ